MQRQVTNLNFAGENIYAGIDTHKRNWKVALYHEDISLKSFTQDPDPDLLVSYLTKNYPGANYFCAYEAGFCGFWIQKALSKRGIYCIVVNPADVPTTSKEKEFKTDPRDCRKIAQSLRAGQLDPIYIPTDEGLESRNVVRFYTDMVKNRTRYKNKIKALLNFYGISYPREFRSTNRHWSTNFYSWLRNVELKSDQGTWVFQSYVQESLKARELVKEATRKVRELSREKNYSKRVVLLRSISGIGLITSMMILTEIEDINRFSNLDELCGYIGIIPSTNSSGDKEIIGEMTHRGNKHLKSAIIESSWMAIRHDPGLLKKYLELTKRMDSNKAIVRIARKLVARIFYVLVNEKAYEIRKN